MEVVMSDIKKVIGNNLRYIRYQSGLSQEKFYEKYHLSVKYLSSIERGEINIGVELLEQLANTFHISPAELVTYYPDRVISKKRIDQKRSH